MELSTQVRIKELEVRGVRFSSGETSEASFDVSKHKGVGTCLILGGPNYKIYKLSKINALNYGSYTFFADVHEHSKKFKSEARALK